MSEATEEIERLRAEVERLETVDADREKYFALLKEREAELKQQLAGMTEARDRFCGSVNRLAEIVGLSGKQCFAPEAVERKAKYELATLREERDELKDAIAKTNTANQRLEEERDRVTERLNEAREHRNQEQAEVVRLKTAAVECDFRVLKCPVLKGEDLELLDPVDSIIEVAPGTDFGEGIVDEEGTVVKVGPDGEVKQIPYPDCTKFLSCPHRDCDYYEPDPPGCKRADEEEAKQEKNVQREQDALDEVDDKD